MKQSVYLIRVYNPFVLVDDAKLGAFDALCKVISPKWERKIPKRDGCFPFRFLFSKRQQNKHYGTVNMRIHTIFVTLYPLFCTSFT